MADKKATKKIIKKKKKWIKIVAPKAFREASLGESPVFEAENLIGRIIKVNLMSLLKDPRKQNMSISFKITKIEGDIARTECYGYEILPSMIKRLVKRRKQKIEDSFVVKTKDGKNIRIKPMAITNSKINNTIKTAIKKRFKFEFATNIAKLTVEEFFSEMLGGKMLPKYKDAIKKIYPLKIVEMKKVSIARANAKPIDPKDYSQAVVKKILNKKVKEVKEEPVAEEKPVDQ